MRSVPLLLLILATACGGATPSDGSANQTSNAGAQAIQLSRPEQAGAHYVVTLNGQQQSRTQLTVNGQSARDDSEDIAIVLTADVSVQAVNAHGKVSESQYVVRECTTGGATPETLLPAGSVLLVTAADGPTGGGIRLQGGELSAEQLERLKIIIGTHNSMADDDEIFGTPEPQQVGSRWPVNAEAVASGLSQSPSMNLSADQVSGETHFVSMEDVGGVSCQHLEASISASGLDLEGLPPGAAVQQSSIAMTMSGSFPVDSSARQLRSQEELSMDVVVQIPTPDGSTALMTITSHRVKTREVHP